ncbi:MAG: polysaccharide biosynthesis/export family protein [Gemmatimonadetes bacterium]|jgi:protein involved in polysaccharide export with SLBB domain|nr:polysaccharide biosynthesis/export family protein [Gemmatimonadota bacterium]
MTSTLRRRLFLGGILALGACRPSAPVAPTPLPQSMLRPWTTQPGDIVRVNVWREPELSGDLLVQNDSTAIVPSLGRMKLGGLTADSLNSLLITRFRDRIVNTPVDVRLIRPVPVFGSVRAPGVYPVDPTSTAIQVIARAGGTVGAEGLPRVQLLRFDGTKLNLTVEQSLGAFDLRSGDAIFVQDQSFWIRNQRQITTVAAVSTIIASVISIIVLLGN